TARSVQPSPLKSAAATPEGRCAVLYETAAKNEICALAPATSVSSAALNAIDRCEALRVTRVSFPVVGRWARPHGRATACVFALDLRQRREVTRSGRVMKDRRSPGTRFGASDRMSC